MHIIIKWLTSKAIKIVLIFFTVMTIVLLAVYVKNEWGKLEAIKEGIRQEKQEIIAKHQKLIGPTELNISNELLEQKLITAATHQYIIIQQLKEDVGTWLLWKRGPLKAKLAGHEKVYDGLIASIREVKTFDGRTNDHWLTRLYTNFIFRFWPVVKITAGIILMPILIKFVFYWILAPICAKAKPIRLVLIGNKNNATKEPAPTAVSIDLQLQDGEEALLRQGFLQSSSEGAKKRTRYLLNMRYPFTSLLSGMFGLTSIRPHNHKPTRVTVSSQKDGLTEIGVLELYEGESLVLQARALAGVIQTQKQSVHISRHWRIGSLHAWLTWQLRFLAFHGPCKLILKGHRGIRIETPGLSDPRMINQESTLGFSTSLHYKCVRTETFIPYLFGQESLFNDRFSGKHGYFVYEEMPNHSEGSGGAKGKLEGITDGLLKVFGI